MGRVLANGAAPPRATRDAGRRWRRRPPRLSNDAVTIREIAVEDAAALAVHLTEPAVVRYLVPGPGTAAGFRRFARWARQQRGRGTFICFAIVPAGETRAVGLLQMWPIDPNGYAAEWGVVIARPWWGTGLFRSAVELFVPFAFRTVGASRLEARTIAANARGNAALRKIGAHVDGTLRRAAQHRGRATDVVLWSLHAADRPNRSARRVPRAA
jgi:RimJ/RimL family protein N-acetyltransferase